MEQRSELLDDSTSPADSNCAAHAAKTSENCATNSIDVDNLVNSRFLLKGDHTPSSFAPPEENPPRILSPVRHVTFNQQTYRDFLKNHHHIIHHVSRSRGRTRGSRAPEVRAYSVFHTAAGNPNETNRLPKARRAVTVHRRGMHIQVPPTPDGPPCGQPEGAGPEPQQINTTEQRTIASRSLVVDRGKIV